MPDNPNKIFQFWQELKRRNVVRRNTVYAATAFIILELVSIVEGPLKLPDWTLPLVIVLLTIGLIVSVILSWIYEINPEGGLERTKPSEQVHKERRSEPSNSWKIATYISAVVIIGLVLYNITSSKKQEGTGINEVDKTIAVLPFENMSSNEENAYFGDAMTDEIIMQLYKINEFNVRSRTSVMQYKDTEKTSPAIGEELKVNYLIEGSAQRYKDQIRPKQNC